MKPAASALTILLLLTVTGCAYLKRLTPGGKEQAKSESKLKATTNRLVLETHYGEESFSPPVPSPKAVGRYHFKESWIPGEIRFEGVSVADAFTQAGTEPKKNRGVRVDITSMNYVFEGRHGEQRRHISFLDETEAHDFDTALSYLASTASEWTKKKPDPRQEMSYLARDSFAVTLAFDQEGLMATARSGEGCGGVLKIPAANLGDVQAKLRAVLETLKAK